MSNWTLSTEEGAEHHMLIIAQNGELVFERSSIDRDGETATVRAEYRPGSPATRRQELNTGMPVEDDAHLWVEISVEGSTVHQEKIKATGSGT